MPWSPLRAGKGTVTHESGDLDAHKVVVGNGSADAKTIASTRTAGQYLRSGGASADPAMASIAQSEVTNLVSDLALKAPLASPTFTGDPKAPTPSPGDNDTSIATTAFVTAAITAAGGGTWIEEVPSGTLDSSNTTFTLSHTPIAGTLDLQLNIAQREGTDFTISGPTITMTVAPKFTDTGWFFARYQY